MKKFFLITLVLLFFCDFSVGAEEKILKMATTTSTNDTGLLDYLAKPFKDATGITLQWVSVGTGKALELGKNCDVDILLVHSPSAEKKIVDEGHGIRRVQVMFNDFVVIGTKDDTSKIKGLTSKDAFAAISKTEGNFVSRGDKSGTHNKEMKIWEKAAINPVGQKWYKEAGQGMMQTINMSNEMKGYALTDRGTYIKYDEVNKSPDKSIILVEGDEDLKNQYSVITINPEKCKSVKKDLALEFEKWIASEKGQKIIADFKMSGKQLFFPNAGK